MLRERITVTLEPELVASVDQLVDKQTLRNRSHAFEHLLKEGIGLHQLEQAFLFFNENWTQVYLEKVLRLLVGADVRTLYLCLPTSMQPATQDIQAIIHHHSSTFTTQIVPADFGSGGALALKKDELLHPFVIIWLETESPLPTSLVPLYTFHRQHHALLTRAIHLATHEHYEAIGIDIAQPNLVANIPAGVVHLRETVYPRLTEERNVRAYVF